MEIVAFVFGAVSFALGTVFGVYIAARNSLPSMPPRIPEKMGEVHVLDRAVYPPWDHDPDEA